MAVTVSGTSITFNDATVQTTAFTGGTSIPAVNAVGAIQVMLVTRTLYSPGQQFQGFRTGDTISGSYVFYSTGGNNAIIGFGFLTGSGFTINNRTTAFTYPGTSGSTYTPTSGTWRVMMAAGTGGYYQGCCSTGYAAAMLMQRIA